MRNKKDIEKLTSTNGKIVFLLFGDINELPELVDQLKQKGKLVFIHVDLISGLSSHESTIDYIKKSTNGDGIISTKSYLVNYANQIGLYGIQRYFLIDSKSLENVLKQIEHVKADFIEIMPAVREDIIEIIARSTLKPIIVGGLITKKQEVMKILSAGAASASTSEKELWNE